MDLPDHFNKFCINLNLLEKLNFNELQELILTDQGDFNYFLSQRTPKEVSKLFWKSLFF